MRALKAFAALLSYPSRDLQSALPQIREILSAERRLPRADRARVDVLIAELAAADLIGLQERYVAMFDRGRATSLNLYEHVHGDSRDRGQAMVDLASVYRAGGLALATTELPDHLPVLLEYLSTRPFDEARDMLIDCAHLVRAIGDSLAQRGSAYAAVLGALLAIAGERGLTDVRNASAVSDEKAIDDEWAEAPVLFGLGCGDARDQGGAKPMHFVRKSA